MTGLGPRTVAACIAGGRRWWAPLVIGGSVRRLGLGGVPAAAGALLCCQPSLSTPVEARVDCATAVDCPAPLVCVIELGRCFSPGSPCVDDVAGVLVPAPDGRSCTAGDGSAGVCGDGDCGP